MDKFLVKRLRIDIQVEQKTETVPTMTVSLAQTSADHQSDALGAGQSGLRVGPIERDWLTKYPWLKYDDTNDRVFCTICQNASDKRLLDDSKCVKQSAVTILFFILCACYLCKSSKQSLTNCSVTSVVISAY
jgi:hypothetical protein